MSIEPKFPWRIDTNDRYRETVTAIIGLSSATLLLPVFLARDFLGLKEDVALINVFTCSIYWAWFFLGLSILSGVLFCFFSAKWVRIAWDQPVSVLGVGCSERFVERALEISFWGNATSYVLGLVLVVYFFVTFSVGP